MVLQETSMKGKGMENLPLHLKYRPKTFDEFIGNESLVESLNHVIHRKNRQVRSFLFTGPSGCGKTTLARIITNEFGCKDKDVFEYNSSNTRGIDTIREIIANVIYAPMGSPYKVYIMDEAHRMTIDAQNALLKILEDTPDHVRFIICTTEPEKLLLTIRNRCSIFQVNPLNIRDMVKLLKGVNEKENFNFSPNILREIAKIAQGSARKALVLLEKISDFTDEESAFKSLTEGIPDETKTIDLCRGLLKKDWGEVSSILKGLQAEPEIVRFAILGYMNSVLLSKGDMKVAELITYFTESFISSGKAGLTLACFMSCK